MKTKPRLPLEKEQKLIDTAQVRPIRGDERARVMRLLKRHHYLGELRPVGEQVLYVAVGQNGGWRAIRVFSAAANHLAHSVVSDMEFVDDYRAGLFVRSPARAEGFGEVGPANEPGPASSGGEAPQSQA